MYSKIVYAVDINETFDNNLKKATAIAKLHQALLKVVYIVKPVLQTYNYFETSAADSIQDQLIQEANVNLNYALKDENNISHDVLIGDPAQAIVEYAKEEQFDAIILNGNVHNVFGRLGSVADRVANYATVDVIILKSKNT